MSTLSMFFLHPHSFVFKLQVWRTHLPSADFFFIAPFFPGGSDGKESAYNTGVPGSIPGLGRSPEKGMATHSSVLAWRTPWTEEPGGL